VLFVGHDDAVVELKGDGWSPAQWFSNWSAQGMWWQLSVREREWHATST